MLEIILLPLIALCFYLPFSGGRKRFAFFTLISLLSCFIFISLWLSAILLTIAYLLLFSFCITFIGYWSFRKFELKKAAVATASTLALFFVYLCLSPWIDDWMFSANDATEVLNSHKIYFSDSIELVSNESGGLVDYYHVFKVRLSEKGL